MMTVYQERARMVAALVKAAESLNYASGYWFDSASGTQWPVVFIDLPTGQVTWHIHEDDFRELGLDRLRKVANRWDAHDVDEKYRRLDACEWERDPSMKIDMTSSVLTPQLFDELIEARAERIRQGDAEFLKRKEIEMQDRFEEAIDRILRKNEIIV